MTRRLYRALLWYALLKGGYRGLKQAFRRRQPQMVLLVDKILKEHYVDLIRDQMRAPSLLDLGQGLPSSPYPSGAYFAIPVREPEKVHVEIPSQAR